MKTKPLTFLLALTFLFLFSGSVFGDDLQDAGDAYAKEDYETAYKLYLPLAKQGNANAQFNLGSMYFFGHGVPQNDKEAIKWYRHAAEQGHEMAQSELDYSFSSENTSYMSLVRLAEQGDLEAQLKLGRMYDEGKGGVIQSRKKAFKWWKLAAEQGHVEAQRILGDIYVFGYGVPQDGKEGEKWLLLAAEQGDARAQHRLGSMYTQGYEVPKNFNEGVKWYRLATAQGYEWNKKGLYKNMEKGNVSEVLLNFIKTLARDGDVNSQLDLGRLYSDGERIPRDMKESAKWYRLAAERGHAIAQQILGLLHEAGIGVSQDYVLAHMWFNLSGSQGEKESRKKVNELESKMTPSQIEKAKEMARNWKPKTKYLVE